MAIVKMKKLSAIVPRDCRRQVLRQLYSMGCVELESATPTLLSEYGDLLHTASESGAGENKAVLSHALDALNRYSPQKVPLLSPRRPISEQQLFDRTALEQAVKRAGELVQLNARIEDNQATQNRLQGKIIALLPWEHLDIPLEYEGSTSASFFCGVLPSAVELGGLIEAVAQAVPASSIVHIGSDREQHYLTLLVYRPEAEAALALLKQRGFMSAGLKGLQGTAMENITALSGQIAALESENQQLVQALKNLGDARESICAALDAYAQEAGQDALLSTVGQTEKTVLLTGWIPAEAQERVASALTALGCAWQTEEPQAEDAIPVAYRNNALVDPFVGVTDMYGTPTYQSMIDPNPMMSIFYFTFFGFMLADAMYGVLMFVGCYLAIKRMRPAGTMKRMLKMFMYCGVSTFIAGALTGSWFADSVAVVSTWLTGNTLSIPPLWFDPLSDPMTMLAFALGLGVIQISTGMGIAAYRMIRQGRPMDAVLDVGSWFVLFIGVGLFALAGLQAGLYLAGAGALLLLLTGGRKNTGLGKITGGLGSLYNITGYISDLLSYSRIMALGLSGAVVGQVINKIATMADGILGLLLFVSVFTFGHIFNIAISLLGAYVHASRLQYIEFFGRFFEDGGRPFKPMMNNTKFVEIIKED